MTGGRHEQRLEVIDRQMDEGQLYRALDNLVTLKSSLDEVDDRSGYEADIRVRAREIAERVTEEAPEILEEDESRFAYANTPQGEVDGIASDLLEEMGEYIIEYENPLREIREEASWKGVEEELEAARQILNDSGVEDAGYIDYDGAWRSVEAAEEYADNLGIELYDVETLRDEIAHEAYNQEFARAIQYLRAWPENNEEPENIRGDLSSAIMLLESAQKFADYAGVQFPEDVEEFSHERVHSAIEKTLWPIVKHVDSDPFAASEKLERLEKFGNTTGTFNEAIGVALERAEEMKELHNGVGSLYRDARDIENEVQRSEFLKEQEDIDDIVGALAASIALEKLEEIEEEFSEIEEQLDEVSMHGSAESDLREKMAEIDNIREDYQFLHRLNQ